MKNKSSSYVTTVPSNNEALFYFRNSNNPLDNTSEITGNEYVKLFSNPDTRFQNLISFMWKFANGHSTLHL